MAAPKPGKVIIENYTGSEIVQYPLTLGAPAVGDHIDFGSASGWEIIRREWRARMEGGVLLLDAVCYARARPSDWRLEFAPKD